MNLKVGHIVVADLQPGFLVARITKLLDVVWVEPEGGEPVPEGDIEVQEYDTTSSGDPKHAAYFPAFTVVNKRFKGPNSAQNTRFLLRSGQTAPAGHLPVLNIIWSESLLSWGSPDIMVNM